MNYINDDTVHPFVFFGESHNSVLHANPPHIRGSPVVQPNCESSDFEVVINAAGEELKYLDAESKGAAALQEW